MYSPSAFCKLDSPSSTGKLDSPSSTSGDSSRASARSSFVESFRTIGLHGVRIDKEDLRRRILIPEYLRLAMNDAIRSKDPNVGYKYPPGIENCEAPEAPMVVFVNSRSGGRHGPVLKDRLQELMGDKQVYDLSAVKPPDFVQYGLACLENMAALGDYCAKETREKLRIVRFLFGDSDIDRVTRTQNTDIAADMAIHFVAGGDGTAGWILGSLAELYKQSRDPVPPTGIIPLGTGNDLSRSFGWGGSFPFAWKSAVKRSLYRAVTGAICRLDSWHVTVSMPAGETVDLPYSLKHLEEYTIDQDLDIEAELPEELTCFEGVFYNYFSIGMDAQVAYGFHQLRDEKPYLAQGPIANKLIYSGYGCSQGWFCTPCMSDPSLRGLKNILRLHIKKDDSSEWEQLPVPSGVRAIVALNLHHYASGRNPWGHLKPEYLEKRGFVEAQADDGLLEIFGLKQGWHASFVMVELISAKHIAQAAAIRLEIRGGEWEQAFMQMDGEPWKQSINKEYSTFVTIKREPFQSLMISGD